MLDECATDISQRWKSVPLPLTAEWIHYGDGAEKVANIVFRVRADHAALDELFYKRF